jgi:hypothetical protein
MVGSCRYRINAVNVDQTDRSRLLTLVRTIDTYLDRPTGRSQLSQKQFSVGSNPSLGTI